MDSGYVPYIIAAVIGFSATVLFVSFRRNSTNSAKGSQGAADAHMVERERKEPVSLKENEITSERAAPRTTQPSEGSKDDRSTAAKWESGKIQQSTPNRATLSTLPDPKPDIPTDLLPDPAQEPMRKIRSHALADAQGSRPSMEDATYMKVDDEYAFFGVYDGHGGAKASLFVGETFHDHVISHAEFTKDTRTALRDGVLMVEEKWCEKGMEEKLLDGTTLVAGVLRGNALFVANVGDSELVVSRRGKAEVVTVQHNPSKNEDEINRIIEAGGRLYRQRIGHPHLNKTFFNLGVSRAIGDLMYKNPEYTDGKESGLIAEPHLCTVNLDDVDGFIVACDGLWDVVSYQDAIDFVRERSEKGASADEVMETPMF